MEQYPTPADGVASDPSAPHIWKIPFGDSASLEVWCIPDAAAAGREAPSDLVWYSRWRSRAGAVAGECGPCETSGEAIRLAILPWLDERDFPI